MKKAVVMLIILVMGYIVFLGGVGHYQYQDSVATYEEYLDAIDKVENFENSNLSENEQLPNNISVDDLESDSSEWKEIDISGAVSFISPSYGVWSQAPINPNQTEYWNKDTKSYEVKEKTWLEKNKPSYDAMNLQNKVIDWVLFGLIVVYLAFVIITSTISNRSKALALSSIVFAGYLVLCLNGLIGISIILLFGFACWVAVSLVLAFASTSDEGRNNSFIIKVDKPANSDILTLVGRDEEKVVWYLDNSYMYETLADNSINVRLTLSKELVENEITREKVEISTDNNFDVYYKEEEYELDCKIVEIGELKDRRTNETRFVVELKGYKVEPEVENDKDAVEE